MQATKEMARNGITVDAKFSSFETLETEIDKYQHENYVQFYRRDSWTIDAALRRAPKLIESSTLISNIQSWCIRAFMGERNLNLNPNNYHL